MLFKKKKTLCAAHRERQGHASHLCHLTPRPFKSDCTSRFVHSRRASTLVLESIRNRQAKCHLESRVIPADDSHTVPLFEECLQVASAARRSAPESGAQAPNHAHLPSQLAYGIEDGAFTAASSLISDMDSDMSASLHVSVT